VHSLGQSHVGQQLAQWATLARGYPEPLASSQEPLPDSMERKQKHEVVGFGRKTLYGFVFNMEP